MSVLRHVSLFVLTASIVLLASYNSVSVAGPAAKAAPKAAPFVAGTGGATTIRPSRDSDNLRGMLSVVQLDVVPIHIDKIGVRMIGTAVGDPAMNGVFCYLTMAADRDEKVFLIGDFNEYKIKRAVDGRIDLEVNESVMNSGGEIGSRTRRIIISWTVGTNPNADIRPQTVTVTTAR